MYIRPSKCIYKLASNERSLQFVNAHFDKMKSLIVMLSLFALSYAQSPELLDEIKTYLKDVGKQCKEELGANHEDLEPMFRYALPTTEKGKCFLACMNKKQGFQDADGKVHKEGIFTTIEKLKSFDEDYYNKVKTVTETCLGQDHDTDDECETALSMYQCSIVESENAGIPKIDFS